MYRQNSFLRVHEASTTSYFINF